MSRCLIVLSFLIASNARAFCGFYVAKGDAKIFNRASQVVLVRDADRTARRKKLHTDPGGMDGVTGGDRLVQRGRRSDGPIGSGVQLVIVDGSRRGGVLQGGQRIPISP